MPPCVFGPTIGTQPLLPPTAAIHINRPMTEALAKILVADDEPDLRALLQRYLSDQGYSVRTVDGAGPLDVLLQRERFDVLVLDVMMPGEDGLSICRRLRAQGETIPILMLRSAQPSRDGSVRVAAYFRYDWTLNDGREVTFTCVDVFTFDAGSTRIRDMNIVYDTHPLREEVGDKYAPD